MRADIAALDARLAQARPKGDAQPTAGHAPAPHGDTTAEHAASGEAH
jgi:NADH-quinone oxidoreductase subunit M